MAKGKAEAPPWRDRVLGLERVRAGDLAGNPENWRRHPPAQVEALKGVLSEVGFAGALLAYQDDGKLTLIDGHLRAGLDPDAEVPVLVLDVDREEARKLLATYDPLGAMAAPDQDALLALLQSVDSQSQAVKDMLEALANGSYAPLMPMPNMEPEEGLTDPDDVPEVPVESWVKRGDIFQLGQHRVMCGDAQEDILVLLDGMLPDILLTDPPYGINLDTNYSSMPKTTRDFAPIKGDDIPFDASFIRTVCMRITEQFWFGADYYAHTLGDTEHSGSWMVWDKRVEEQYDSGFGSIFELIWSARRRRRTIFRHQWFQNHADNPSEAGNRFHPTQKPISLIAAIIEMVPGHIILDPFLGSGTTLIACEKLGRKCMGMEISEGYVEIAIRRWQAFTGRQALLERTGETFDQYVVRAKAE